MAEKAEVVDNFIRIYRYLTRFPTPVSGFLLRKANENEALSFVSSWSQRNLENGVSSKLQRLHIVNNESKVQSYPPVDVSQELLSAVSKSGKLTATVRSVTKENTKKQFLEVWNSNGRYKNFNVTASELHGDIYTDGEFGCLEWSNDETKLVYVAEKKPDKTEPFYKQKTTNTGTTEQEEPIRGGEYVYKPDWGEQLEGKQQPVIVYFDIEAETTTLVPGLPDHYSPGQLLWNSTSDGLFGVALENEPRRLGLIYCTNRLGYIFHLTLDGQYNSLSGDGTSVRSPRLSDDGKLLLWLQRPAGGPHAGCQQLMKHDVVNKQTTTIVDIVRTNIKITDNKDFYGIYSQKLPKRCLSNDGKLVIFSTPQKFTNKSYSVHLDNLTITEIEEVNSLTVLDLYDDYVLCSVGNMSATSSLKTFRLTSSFNDIKWITITEANNIVGDCVIRQLDLVADNTGDSFREFNALYIGPKQPDVGKIPLIVFPHGGPHSSYVNQFMLDPAFFVSIGYGVLMVNYRGSLGCGQDSVDFLLGKIGDTDVKDCQQALTEMMSLINYIDGDKIVLYGGSHGGFLISHLSGQYPDSYKAVAMRNGVIDVSAMYTITDIPDWCTVETGLLFDQTTPPTLDNVNRMSTVSPIRYADKVTAATLIFIGKKDLRVPFSQGLYLYNTLKARNIKTKLIVYEDNHALELVPHEIDRVINTALWFQDALQLTLS